MHRPACILLAGALAIGCAGLPPSAPPPRLTPAPELLLPRMVSDLARAECVAYVIAGVTELEANRLQLREAGSRIAEVNAQTRVEQAESARAKALSAAATARAAAGTNTTDEGLRSRLMMAEDAAANAAVKWQWSDNRRLAAARAAEAVAGSAQSAFRFAQLARAHAVLFEYASRTATDRAAAGEASAFDAEDRAMRSLIGIATSAPELEWLYVERFTRSMDTPDRCR